jgi:hypothetical protein
MHVKTDKWTWLYPWIIMVIACVPLLSMMMQGALPFTHERTRYASLGWLAWLAISDGAYPWWLPDLSGGMGYPTFVYYQPLAIFHIGAMTAWCQDFTWGVILSIWMWAAISGCALYRLSHDAIGHPWAFAGVALYLWDPWLFNNIYVRGDLSEALCVYMAPITVLATISWIRSPTWISLFACVMAWHFQALTHPLANVWMMPCLVLVSWILLGFQKRLIAPLLIVSILSVMTSSWYWGTAMSMMSAVDHDGALYDPTTHFKPWTAMFYDSVLVAGTYHLPLITGIWITCACAACVFALKYRSCALVIPAGVIIFAIGIVTGWVPWPWGMSPWSMMQFPWRIYVVMGLMTWMIIILIHQHTSHRWIHMGISIMLVVALLSWLMPTHFMHGNTWDRRQDIQDYAWIHGDAYAVEDEFRPISTRGHHQRGATHWIEPISSDMATISDVREGVVLKSALVTTSGSTSVLIHQWCYPGHRVTVNGHDAPWRSYDGRLLVDLPPGASLVTWSYAYPPPFSVWFIISCASAMLIAVVVMMMRRRGLLRFHE